MNPESIVGLATMMKEGEVMMMNDGGIELVVVF